MKKKQSTIEVFDWNRSQFVRVEDKPVDHLTTTMGLGHPIYRDCLKC